VPYGVGIDLGTSFTSAAVGGSSGERMVPIGPDVIVPSVAYPEPDGTLLTGEKALAAASDPANVARNFKRRLGDPTPLLLNGSVYSPAALMAAQLRDVLDQVSETMGGAPGLVVVTCPAIWGPYRTEHFTEVLRLANVSNYELVTEPEAAATHYSRENRLGDGEVVAVYDLGGGTFDTTILRMRAGGMEILGTPEGIEHMGGIDFDEALLAHIDGRLDGAVSTLDPTDAAAAAALAEIRAMCVRAKEELSTEPDVTLSVPLPTGPRAVTITRLELNETITPAIRQTIDALHRTIASAGLAPSDLSAVLLAGGSSRIPLISQLVKQEFGRPVRMTLHPKYTVALGAAAIAARPKPAAPVQPAALVQPTAPDHPGPTPGSRSRGRWAAKGWLVPAAAVAATLVAVTALLIAPTTDEVPGSATPMAGASTESTSSRAPTTSSVASPPPVTTTLSSATQAPSQASPTKPPIAPLPLFNGGFATPYKGFIAGNSPGVTNITAGGGSLPSITASADGEGLKVSWKGDSPAAVFLQTPGHVRDLSPYVNVGARLVFDVTVFHPPTELTTIAVHCDHPCGSSLRAEKIFQQLPTGRKTTLSISLSCYTLAGLDASRVDTPFLVYSEAEFSAVFSDVRWEQQPTTEPTNHSCGPLL
jgi:actin-like ATPase involved in cell morphogenesis